MTDKKKKKAPAAKARGKNVRATINARALIEALEQHVLGENEMTSTQVSAALALLKKILPDVTKSGKETSSTPVPKNAHEDALKDLE